MESNIEETIDTINSFLDAFPADTVRAALKKRSLFLRGERMERGWKVWTKPGVPEPPIGWMRVGDVVYYREGDPPRHPVRVEKPKKTDTGVAPVDGLACPECGGGLYKEGVCPGCEAGRRGVKIRLLCGNCDFTAEL